ncbi:HAD-IC family P-type ATPase, partial [uncultured Selenomonas sp.]|uniref:HAD-IC family P-type ATPase n=1 Tax=uncultured Selenomonas sp. TaxID=159275 RepID=UPI00261BBCB7
GRGVSAKVAGRKLLCGSEGYLAENGIMLEAPMREALERLRAEGKALVLAAEEERCIGALALSDTLRPEAKAMVGRLHAMDVRTVLLTGDNEEAAAYFAHQVGIDEIHAELLPEDKVAHVKKLQEKGCKILMIGDGVNDAPALKCADVSAAMGAMGSDIAVEAADIALMRDDIAQAPYLKRLANATATTIKLSITLSMCINFAAIVLSLMQKLNPTTGALVHNAGSCFVVLIAALLYDRKFD